VYAQSVPDPAITDEESHLGAADVEFEPDDLTRAEGVYWTRRQWRLGLNTAGKLTLRRLSERSPQKTLREYAAEEQERLAAGGGLGAE